MLKKLQKSFFAFFVSFSVGLYLLNQIGRRNPPSKLQGPSMYWQTRQKPQKKQSGTFSQKFTEWRNSIALKTCEQCHGKYTWEKSSATLKMTYCSSACESHALGFHIDTFLKQVIVHKSKDQEPPKPDAQLTVAPVRHIEREDRDDESRELVPA